MKEKLGMLKGFVIVMVFLFIFMFLLSLLIPSRVVLTKSISISDSTAAVFSKIQDLKEWQNWYPLFKDSMLAKSDPQFYHDSIKWKNGKSVNTLAVLERNENAMRFEMYAPGENKIDNMIVVYTDSSLVKGSTVQWNSIMNLGWLPWNKFAGIFAEKIGGPGYDSALSSLKNYVESSVR